MKLDETTQEIIDMIETAYTLEKLVSGESTVREIGLSSFDALEVQIMVEYRWGLPVVFDMDTKIADVSLTIAEGLSCDG